MTEREPEAAQVEQASRDFFAALDRRRGASLRDLVAADFLAEVAGRPPLDADAFAAALATLYAAFPDLEHVVLEVLVQGARAALRLLERGTHRGAFARIAPSGRVVEMQAMAWLELVDGRVARLAMVADTAGRLQQLQAR